MVGRPKIHPEGQTIVKTVIYLRQDAHKKLKHLAVEEGPGASMTELVRRAVDEYLERTESAESTEKEHREGEREDPNGRGRL